ncbi:MAG: ABC transporter ATP-binding protein [Chloroflexi bacterium]|nr:ABC transporter ATP-binding protein [Chloroflexota bacterium]
MSDSVIKVENLTKQYRIGTRVRRSDTFVGSLTRVLSRPVRNIRNLRSLSRFSEDESQSEDVIRALDSVSFSVRQGEVLGIIGRNGSGKSTLLKILSKITEPTSGRAFVKGKVSSLLEVGMGFHPELTGRENVYLNGAILGMTGKEIGRKFDEISDFAGVEKFMETPVKRYSSGMKMRLAFSVAAHLEPEILLIDEVLAVGDAAFREKCVGKMNSVANEGRTIMFVSHDMNAVENVCDRAVLLDEGRVVNDGHVATVIADYLETAERSVSYGTYEKPDQLADSGFRILRATADSEGRPALLGFESGKPITFTVTCHTEFQLDDPTLGIGIDTLDGRRVVTVDTRDATFLAELKSSVKGTFEFSCTMSGLSLVQGDYSVTLDLYKDQGSPEGTQHIEPAFLIRIAESNSRVSIGKKWDGLVIPQLQWALRNQTAPEQKTLV